MNNVKLVYASHPIKKYVQFTELSNHIPLKNVPLASTAVMVSSKFPFQYDGSLYRFLLSKRLQHIEHSGLHPTKHLIT